MRQIGREKSTYFVQIMADIWKYFQLKLALPARCHSISIESDRLSN